MSGRNEQIREDYPVDAFAEYQEHTGGSDNGKNFGEHSTESYNKILGMGQDDYAAPLPVSHDLGPKNENPNMNPLANVGQERSESNEMRGFTKDDFTNVPGTGGTRTADRYEGKHLSHSKSGTRDSAGMTGSEHKESSDSSKPSGFAKVKDLMTKHHLMKGNSKSDKSKSESAKGRSDMEKNNVGDDDMLKNGTMGAGAQMHGNTNAPSTNPSMGMPMEMKGGDTMGYGEGKVPVTSERNAMNPPKTTVDDADITQDPIASARAQMNEMSAHEKQKKSGSSHSADWNKSKLSSSMRTAENERLRDPLSGDTGISGEGQGPHRGRELIDEGTAGAYANAVGNSPSLVDPSVPTYAHKQHSTDAGTKDERANYMMHTGGMQSGRKVSVGSNNQDVEMGGVHSSAPVTEETNMGYRYHGKDTIPRAGQMEHEHENDYSEIGEPHGHKPGMFERIKRTLSNKSDH
ncbi:hypothetical protein HG535_0G01240 [Zygotorulaspora mrakii]|uniref:Uncharacterized protein n=1 Tax=Zygotorulaspora mrakii TaxID=42260 RepID=A0A7H9B6T0_ZYGMR|nr:uncharacterized protein HG535_0G01240 [Zygotorulaspora mrakii]QLG74240.1 hypothetical protein HG535_0G01240 [Zygotorulaspora mrakii]